MGAEERGALAGTHRGLSQSDLFRLVAASMREHSNLAIFARANLKKHERLTRAKMLLITRGRITCRKTKTVLAARVVGTGPARSGGWQWARRKGAV